MKSISIHRFTLLFSAVTVFIFLVSACGKKADEGAHTLVLKNGTVLKGELVSRSEAAIKFESGGETREVPLEEVYSLTLKEGEAPVYLAAAAEQPPVAEEPAPPRRPGRKNLLLPNNQIRALPGNHNPLLKRKRKKRLSRLPFLPAQS